MTDTWADSIPVDGPTLDDIFDLRGEAEVDEYREWAESLGMDPWATVTFDLWVTDRPEPAREADDHWARENRC